MSTGQSLRYHDKIHYTVVVNFKQSSYKVKEGRADVTVVIELTQPSSEPFQVMISLMDATAKCK